MRKIISLFLTLLLLAGSVDGNGTVGLGSCYAAGRVFAGYQPATSVVGIAVRHVTGAPKGLDSLVGTPPTHVIARDVAKNQMPLVGVPDRTLGEHKTPVKLGEFQVITNDIPDAVMSNINAHRCPPKNIDQGHAGPLSSEPQRPRNKKHNLGGVGHAAVRDQWDQEWRNRERGLYERIGSLPASVSSAACFHCRAVMTAPV